MVNSCDQKQGHAKMNVLDADSAIIIHARTRNFATRPAISFPLFSSRASGVNCQHSCLLPPPPKKKGRKDIQSKIKVLYRNSGPQYRHRFHQVPHIDYIFGLKLAPWHAICDHFSSAFVDNGISIAAPRCLPLPLVTPPLRIPCCVA